MKKYMIILVSILLLVCQLSLGATVSAATGSLSVTPSANTAIVGETITVTVTYNGNENKIASISSVITYDANKLTLVSGSGPEGATTHGDAGVIRAIFEMPSTGILPTSVAYTLVFKATGTGDSEISVTTEEFVNNDDTYSSLGSPSKTISIAATNPTLSGDATLSYLRPSKGTLTPKFDKDVTEYTVSVPYTVTKGLLNFSATDPNAKTKVTDNADLKVGKNTRVITVTAPNGTTKKYTVVITREAEQSTTTGNQSTTTTLPVIDVPEVEVNGVLLQVAVNQPTVNPPEGFVWDYLALGDHEVSAARWEQGKMTLLYLTDAETGTAAFYIYDPMTDSFTPFRQLIINNVAYVLHDLPASETAPSGTAAGAVTVGEQEITAYVYQDPTLVDFVILQLTGPTGETGLYTYDQIENTIQRYHPVTVEREVFLEPEGNNVTLFFEVYGRTILICASALAGVAACVILAIWLIGQSGKSKGKH